MKQYLDLVKHVLDNGTRKENRTGVDTLSTFNYNYEVDLREGFPLLTTKEISWKNIVCEILWFLSGETNVDLLERHGCRFWSAWSDPVTKRVPSAYGNFWRRFPVIGAPDELENHYYPTSNDQIKWVMEEMKRNPMSRRLVGSAWAPGNAQTSKLPPCHAMYVFNVQAGRKPEVVHMGTDDGTVPMCFYKNKSPSARFAYTLNPAMVVVPLQQAETEMYKGRVFCDACQETYMKVHNSQPVPNPEPLGNELCLALLQRSGDAGIGIPYNIASYALLVHLFSRFSGIAPGIFAHTIVDAHIYTAKPDGSMAEYDHVPGLREQLAREPRPLPKLIIDDSIRTLEDVEALMHPSVTTEHIMGLFRLEGYNPHPPIKLKVAV